MVDRVVTGAGYGLRDWIAQRATAVVMVLYTVLLVILLITNQPLTYLSWKALFAHGWMKVFTAVFLGCLYWHAWIGIRDIFMDYIKSAGTRLFLQVAVILALIIYMVWSVQILWSV